MGAPVLCRAVTPNSGRSSRARPPRVAPSACRSLLPSSPGRGEWGACRPRRGAGAPPRPVAAEQRVLQVREQAVGRDLRVVQELLWEAQRARRHLALPQRRPPLVGGAGGPDGLV